MPITFGLYDFFSYTIPGVLYLVVMDELLKLLGRDGLDVSQLGSNLGSAVFWIILAYIAGQVMDTFAIRWYTFFNHFHAETKAMSDFKRRNADLQIGFNLDDRRILFSVIRHNKPELAQYLDNFKAISIMLNNISLGLFLLGVVELASWAQNGFSIPALLLPLGAFAFAYVGVKRSFLFNEWHWSAVFEHARHFGRTIPEMYGIKEPTGTQTTATEQAASSGKKKHPLKPDDIETEKARLN